MGDEGDEGYSELLNYARETGAALAERERWLVAAACADRVLPTLGAEHELQSSADAVVELTWLAAESGAVSRDERKAAAFAFSEAIDVAYSDLRGADRYAAQTLLAALATLESGQAGERLEAVVEGLADTITRLLDESAWEEAFAEELAWLQGVVARSRALGEREAARELLSWPAWPAPPWLLRGWHELDEDDEDPPELERERETLPALFAERSRERARAMAEKRRGKEVPPWRDPTGLPDELAPALLGRGESASEGNLVTSGHEEYGLVEVASQRLLFAPPAAASLAMNPEQTQVWSWRVQHASGSGTGRADYAWLIERYTWPGRRRIDSYTVQSQEIIACSWPHVMHVPAEHGGKLAILKCRSEDEQLRLFIAYGDTGPLGEAEDAEAALRLVAGAASSARSDDSELPKLVEQALDELAQRRISAPQLARLRASLADREEPSWSAAALELADLAFPKDGQDFSNRASCQRALPCVLALLSQLDAERLDKVTLALLLTRVASFLTLAPDLSRAEQLARRSVELLEALDGQHARLFQPILTLAETLVVRANVAEAEPLLERALELARVQHGKKSVEVAAALRLFGHACYDDDREDEGIKHLRRSLALLRELLPDDHTDVASALNDLGALISDDKPKEAKKLLREALNLRQTAYGEVHPDVATTLDNLADVLDTLDEDDEAEQLSRRAIAMFEQCYGLYHPDVGIAHTNMAHRLSALQRHAEAALHYRRALAVAEEISGAHTPEAAAALRDLGSSLHEQEEHEAAASCFRRALAIDETELGDSKIEVADDLDGWATALQEDGELDAAEPLFRRALAIAEAACDAPDERLASAQHNLACLLKDTKAYTEARVLFERAIENYEQACGESDTQVAHTLSLFAQMLIEIDELNEAKVHLQRALAIDEEEHGAEDDELTGHLLWLAKIAAKKERWREVEAYCARAIAIDEAAHGEVSAEVTVDLEWYGRLLREAERWKAALEVQQRLLSVELERPDSETEEIDSARRSLAEVLRQLGRDDEAEAVLSEDDDAEEHPPEAARDAAYEQVLGLSDYEVCGTSDDEPTIEVRRYDGRPLPKGPRCSVWVTSGMSDREMGTDGDALRRELIFYAPSGGDYRVGLQALAELPRQDQTFLDHGHTVAIYGSFLFPGGASTLVREGASVELPHVVLLSPLLNRHQKLHEHLSIDGSDVSFLWVVPISQAELDLKKAEGLGALLDLFDARKHPWLFNPNRKSYV